LTLDKTIPTVADLLASPLAKYITLAANDCGYSGKAKELIVTYVHVGVYIVMVCPWTDHR
jgi:hypothetical protein